MSKIPEIVADFLQGKRFAVAGVSRDRNKTANLVFRKLRQVGYEVVPVNPNAPEVEGERCYPDLASVPGELDGVVAVTHPRVAMDLVKQCGDRGVQKLWFHRAFGQGSVSAEAVAECRARGVLCIAGGCPLMYCAPDVPHRCVRWLLKMWGRLPE